ncbi:PTS transporter subunit EIIC [Collinsella aerofaciens]|uniref:PTS transporter subunit EIIC n=1 Tax=Collinsella aerofaciens TaxID=74426 RepID=A0A6N9JHF9_9ACTN|nr:PTS transporter subunit EIIC [Collinsella aerofaciens]MZJ38859.1 PTS transporter subunit EIIC [Collinsella aerofaciens]
MTAKKKFNFKAPLEVFAKSIVQPMMYLSVAGILLIVGIILTNKTICALVPVLGSGPFQLVGAIVYQSLTFIINNLSILFCVGIAGAMAKKNKGHASLIALMSFFLFLQANNIVLNATGSLADASGVLGLTGTGQATVMGIQVLDTGVFGGIILGCITGAVFNKYSNKQFPIALSMFSGVRFPFLIMIIISWIMGAGFCIVWPPVQGAISSVAGIIKESGNIGLFIYGMLNKLLVPTGLHHLIYTPFQFSDVGGTLTLGDQVIAGAYPIRVAEMAMTGQPFSDSTYFNSYTFNNLWPYIGIGLAFIFTAYKGNKDKTKAVIIPLIITAVLSCVTEPMDFLFVFAAPVLFVVHSVLSGIFLFLLKVLSVPASTAGGIINIVVSNLVLGVDKTNWPVMLVLGIVNAALYFFLFTFLIKKLNLHTPGREEESELAESVAEGEAAASVAVKQGAVASASAEGVDAGIADLVAGLGGKDNIEELENCFTRLRVNVKNPDLINEDLINHVPNSGINRNGNNVQIIFGMKVAEMRDKVEKAIEKEQ